LFYKSEVNAELENLLHVDIENKSGAELLPYMKNSWTESLFYNW